jgi:hypothetical protein
MKEYRVQWDEIIGCEATVQAESEAEAIEMTYHLSGSDVLRSFDRRAHDEAREVTWGFRKEAQQP